MAEAGEIFIADYPYSASTDTELSLEVNDKIVVVSKEGDWIYGYKEQGGKRIEGWAAASYGHFRQASPYAALDDRSKNNQRTLAFQSLLDSERGFLKTVQDLKEALIDVVSIRDDGFKRNFMNEPSVAVSFTILLDMIKACGNFATLLESCRDEHSVALAFIQFSPSMQLFAQYATENIKLLNAVKTNSKGLKKILPKEFQLETYLVAPTQHYPKYKAFMQEYVWLSPNSLAAKARDELESAMDKVIAQSDYIDLKLKEETEALRLLALQSAFTGHPAIFTPTRRILCEFEIERVRVKANNELDTKAFQAHLFNDCFIYSSYTVTGKLKLQQMASLRQARVERSSIGGTQTGFALYLNDEDTAAEHFRVQDPKEYEDFMVQVALQMEANRANRTEVRTATIARRGTMLGGTLLPGVQLSALGQRAAETYRFLIGEMQFAEAVATLNLVMVEPLLNAAKGAVLRANDGSSGLSMENSTTKYQAALVTEALKEADVLLCLRSVEGLTVSCKEFVGALEKACKSSNWSENVLIGEVFQSVSAQTLFHQFKSYISGQQALLRVLRTAPFAQFYKDCEQILSSAPGTLEEKLDQPRQRIKLFGTFLGNLLRLTKDNHADYAVLQQSIVTVDNMDKEITELLRIKRNFEHLLEIQNSLVTMANEPVIQKLASMDRMFIRQGDLKKVCRRKNKLFRFWLVSDYLIYGGSLGGDKYSFNRAMELHKVSVAAHHGVSESGEPLRFAFAILGAEKSFIVIAPTQANCDEWIDVISKAAAAAREAKGMAGGDADGIAPVWQADGLSDCCTQCQKAFTFWNRKHHCRKCGALVCSDHLKNREILPHISLTVKQKVCDNCVKGFTMAPAVLTSTFVAPNSPVPASSSAAASTPTAAASTSTTTTPTPAATSGGLSSLWKTNKAAASTPAAAPASTPAAPAATTAAASAPLTPAPAASAAKPVAAAPSPAVTPTTNRARTPPRAPAMTTTKPAGETAVANPLKSAGASGSTHSDGMDAIKAGSVRSMIASKNEPKPAPAASEAPKRVATSRAGASIASKLASRNASMTRTAPPPPEEPAPALPSTLPPPVPTTPPPPVPVEAPPAVPAVVPPPVPAPVRAPPVAPPAAAPVAPPAAPPAVPARAPPVPPVPAAAPPAPISPPVVPAAPAAPAAGGRAPPPPPPRGAGAPPPPPPKPPVAPPAAPPAAPAAAVTETLAEDDPFRRFVKMKELMPLEAVRQKMKMAGFRDNDIELFLSGAVSRLPLPGEDGGSGGSSGSGGGSGFVLDLSAASLKPPPAPTPKPAAPAGGMMSLLGEIQRGQKLKAVQADDTRMKQTTAAQTGDMLSMLAMKMTERRFKMGSAMQAGSDSDSDSSGFSDSDSDSDDD